MNKLSSALIEKTIHKIRQRMFNLPENKQPLATAAILRLKSQMNYPHSSDYHWMYAAE